MAQAIDYSSLTIAATKPTARTGKLLHAKGIRLLPVTDDEGNVDRYIVSKRVVLERRSAGAFLMGIMDKTLFTSAIYMREHYRVPILIVEGRVDYERRGFSPAAVRGALSSMMLLYGLTVVSTTDVDDTVELIAMIARQEQIGIPDISLVPKRKATSVPDMQRRIVEMLPQCGMVLARSLLQHFGTFQRVCEASVDDFQQLRGIGSKKAKEMYATLHAEYDSVDTERDIEDALEANPKLLFDVKVELLDRQHHIFTAEKQRHIVDMVYYDARAKDLILVELKRGVLQPAHREQIRRYLDNAGKSRLLRSYLEKGATLRGILATVEPSSLKPKHRDVTVQLIDIDGVRRFLRKRRRVYWGS
jgi:ERCC4-type nuclease